MYIKSFQEFPVKQEILKAIAKMGFTEPTPIQSLTIPVLLDGSDIIGEAQTGTGKTAAFGIPLLNNIEHKDRNLSRVVICPTRELACQVTDELIKLAAFRKDISILAVYGGEPIGKQIRRLKQGVNIIVATPGRLMDHIERKTLRLDKIEKVVLDEADEMLNMGFRKDIEKILRTTPMSRQTILFSATMNKPVIELARKFQKDPIQIKVPHQKVTADDIAQSYHMTKPDEKTDFVSRLIEGDNDRMLLFCNTRRRVDRVTKSLRQKGYSVEGLHGDINQNQRNKIMNKFKKGNLQILVATDVAARGIDVKGIDSVVNYDVPMDPDGYVHRIGRTGRAGARGRALTFITRPEMQMLRKIEKRTGVKMERWQAQKA